MSHFTVLVIGVKNKQEVEEALYPYWELDLSPEEMIKDSRTLFETKIPLADLEAEFQKCITEKAKFLEEKSIYYSNAKQWVEDWHGYGFNEKEQAYGYFCNPNAKWDWFSIGGRWTGYFKPKENKTGKLGRPGVFKNKANDGYVDIIRKGDVDWKSMKADNRKQALETWTKKLEKQNPKKPTSDFESTFKPCSKEELEKRKNDFIRINSSSSTFAVIKDGKWYERGQMGWWACVSNEEDPDDWNKKFDELIDNLSDDTYLALVDCHI